MQPIRDSLGYRFACRVSHNNRIYILLPASNAHFVYGEGMCKSIDKWATLTAIAESIYLLLYFNSLGDRNLEVCYRLTPELIQSGGYEIERWGLVGEQRPKYKDVLLSSSEAINIRLDNTRQPHEGERFWQPRLNLLGFAYIGDKHGNILYTNNYGFCPDFLHLTKNIIIEEGKHSKSEELRRKKLAEEHNMRLYFIPYDINFYRSHPEAVNGVITEIKAKIENFS